MILPPATRSWAAVHRRATRSALHPLHHPGARPETRRGRPHAGFPRGVRTCGHDGGLPERRADLEPRHRRSRRRRRRLSADRARSLRRAARGLQQRPQLRRKLHRCGRDQGDLLAQRRREQREPLDPSRDRQHGQLLAVQHRLLPARKRLGRVLGRSSGLHQLHADHRHAQHQLHAGVDHGGPAPLAP